MWVTSATLCQAGPACPSQGLIEDLLSHSPACGTTCQVRQIVPSTCQVRLEVPTTWQLLLESIKTCNCFFDSSFNTTNISYKAPFQPKHSVNKSHFSSYTTYTTSDQSTMRQSLRSGKRLPFNKSESDSHSNLAQAMLGSALAWLRLSWMLSGLHRAASLRLHPIFILFFRLP